jgi:hypothetical protein
MEVKMSGSSSKRDSDCSADLNGRIGTLRGATFADVPPGAAEELDDSLPSLLLSFLRDREEDLDKADSSTNRQGDFVEACVAFTDQDVLVLDLMGPWYFGLVTRSP